MQRLWKDGDEVSARRVWDEMVEAEVAPNEEAIIGMIKCYTERGPLAFRDHVPHVSELLETLGQTVLNVTGAGLDLLEASLRSVVSVRSWCGEGGNESRNVELCRDLGHLRWVLEKRMPDVTPRLASMTLSDGGLNEWMVVGDVTPPGHAGPTGGPARADPVGG